MHTQKVTFPLIIFALLSSVEPSSSERAAKGDASLLRVSAQTCDSRCEHFPFECCNPLLECTICDWATVRPGDSFVMLRGYQCWAPQFPKQSGYCLGYLCDSFECPQ